MSDWPGAQYCIYGFGGLHNLLSLCILVSYFLSNHPTFPGKQDVKDLILSVYSLFLTSALFFGQGAGEYLQ